MNEAVKQVAMAFQNSSDYLWTDLPDSALYASAHTFQSTDIAIDDFVTSGISRIPNAVDIRDVTLFAGALAKQLALESDRPLATFWNESGKQELPARLHHLSMPECKVLDRPHPYSAIPRTDLLAADTEFPS
jgi:hypothetical protein